MGYDELIAAIGQEAARQRSKIVEDGEAQARKIREEAEAQAGRLLAGAAARGEVAARAEAARLASRARLAARREVLAARQRLIDAVFQALERRLAELPLQPGYGALLGRLLAECLDGHEGPVTVRGRPADRAVLEEQARQLGREVVFEEAPLALGGVETASADGRAVCRNGIAERIEAARPLLLQEAGRVLFGPGGPPA